LNIDNIIGHDFLSSGFFGGGVAFFIFSVFAHTNQFGNLILGIFLHNNIHDETLVFGVLVFQEFLIGLESGCGLKKLVDTFIRFKKFGLFGPVIETPGGIVPHFAFVNFDFLVVDLNHGIDENSTGVVLEEILLFFDGSAGCDQ